MDVFSSTQDALSSGRFGTEFTLTKGVYDILHVGHLESFQYAKRLGLPVLVGVFDDHSVARRKGPGRPVNTQEHRARLVAALRPVDGVVLVRGLSAFELVMTVRPRYFVATHTSQFSADELEQVSEVTEVRLIPKDAGVSTSSILAQVVSISTQTSENDILDVGHE